MNRHADLLAMYLHLAWASARRRRPLVRCRLLLLAAEQALMLDLVDIADYCRQEILSENPAHIVGRWESLRHAKDSADIGSLLRQLRRRYSLERAEQLLQELGINMARERETYASDEEYAASLLGHTPESLRDALSRDGRGEASGDGDGD